MSDLILNKINSGILIIDNMSKLERLEKIQDKIKNNNGNMYLPKFPPNMISMCSRRIVYHLMRLPVILVTDPQLLRIFDNGNSVHERITSYFAASGCLSEHDYKICDEENRIGGYIDLILKLTPEEFSSIAPIDTPGNPFVIGEIKSANSNACYWIERKNEPSKKYVEQLQLYMHVTGIHTGVIIIERKDDQRLFTFYVKYDPNMVADLLEKVHTCLYNADNKIIPPREGSKKSSLCWSSENRAPMCPYYDICWSDTEGKDLIDKSMDNEVQVEDDYS